MLMVIPEIVIQTDSKDEFWATWLRIVQGAFDLRNPTPKEWEMLIAAASSNYKHPFMHMGAKQLSKQLNIPRSKYVNYKTSLKEKGWINDNDDFIQQIQSLRIAMNRRLETQPRFSVSFLMKIAIDKS